MKIDILKRNMLSTRVITHAPTKVLALLNEKGNLTHGRADPQFTSAGMYAAGKYSEIRSASKAYDDAKKMLSKMGYLKKKSI